MAKQPKKDDTTAYYKWGVRRSTKEKVTDTKAKTGYPEFIIAEKAIDLFRKSLGLEPSNVEVIAPKAGKASKPVAA